MSESQTYTFSSKPHAVQASSSRKGGKGVYREESREAVNIMFDPRVFRGSTYSSHTKEKLLAQQAKANQQTKRKKNNNQRSPTSALSASDSAVLGSIASTDPPVVPGRRDMDIQTDTYLEELTDKVEHAEMNTQTDIFLERPSLPLFVPSKNGVDAETQVEVDELFDFDVEVEPILEILVGKTLEHAMMEVLEEEELESIRKHQDRFEQERNVERSKVQRLEAEAIRRNQERLRRIKQEEERTCKEAQVMDKVAARAFASDYLSDLHSNVFDNLMQSGQFYDPLIKEVEDKFLPWLISNVQSKADKRLVARSLLDSIILSSLENAKDKFRQRVEQEVLRQKQRQEELQRQQEEMMRQAKEDVDAAQTEGSEEADGLETDQPEE